MPKHLAEPALKAVAPDASYTTGEIAQALGVDRSTVCGWIDAGQLKGRRYTPTGRRRVSGRDLIAFLKHSGPARVA